MRAAARRSGIESACIRLERCSADLATLLLGVDDPSRPAVGVWDVAETAVHVSQSAPAFLAIARDGAAPEDVERVAEMNRAAVRGEPERRLDVLAERIVDGESELARWARDADGDPMVVPFRGAAMPLSSLLSVELGELLVHGLDIARAAGLRWDIDPTDAAAALDGDLQVLPAMLDPARAPGVRLSCDLRIRRGRRWLITLDDGVLQLQPEASGRDCHLWVDPVDFLLLTFGRIGPVLPLLTGGVVVWGRRPWVFARLQRVLTHV